VGWLRTLFCGFSRRFRREGKACFFCSQRILSDITGWLLAELG
jgi:hypothetical protein